MVKGCIPFTMSVLTATIFRRYLIMKMRNRDADGTTIETDSDAYAGIVES